MYNKYLNNEGSEFTPIDKQQDYGIGGSDNNVTAGILGGFPIGNFKFPQITFKHIVLFAIVYFLLTDCDDSNDILVIVAILIFLGM